MIFSFSKYIIDPNNTNYIQAITRYNLYGYIDQIDGVEWPDIVGNLPKIINQYGSGKSSIEIMIRMANSQATIGVFPDFPANDIPHILNSLSKDEQKVANNAAKMISYYKDEDSQSEGSTCLIIEQPTVDPLSMEEAIAVLLKIDESKVGGALGGAIHFPDINKIVFQSREKDNNYLISYGEKSYIKLMPIFTLDIDDGFISRGYNNKDFLAVLEKLQSHFLKWKASGYVGPILPKESAHFDCESIKNNANKLIIESTKGIFPKPHILLKNNILAKTYENISEAEIKKLPEKVQSILKYFNKNAKEAELGSLSLYQAVLLVNTLSYVLPLTGLAHFNEADRILIQYNGADHIIKYGESAYIMPMTPIFIDRMKGLVGGKMTDVRRILSHFFKDWLACQYQGAMVPVDKIGFDEIVKPALTLQDINNIESLVKFNLANCKKKYDLMNTQNNNEFIRCIRDLYSTLNMTLENHDFFEYCIFYASGVLDFVKASSVNLNLRFWHTAEEIEHNIVYPLATIYLGVDNNLYADPIATLKELIVQLQMGGKANIDDNMITFQCANQLKNLQYGFLMHRQAALKAFLSNPLLVANFLILHKKELNKNFNLQEISKMIEDLNKFRDLNNGPSDRQIDDLIIQLQDVYCYFFEGRSVSDDDVSMQDRESSFISSILPFNIFSGRNPRQDQASLSAAKKEGAMQQKNM